MRVMMRRSAASSSSVHAAKALLRKISTSDATRPSRASRSSSPSRPGSVAGISRTACESAAGGSVDFQRLGECLVLVEEEASEHSVVHRDLIAPGDERGATRPVEVDEVGGVERGHRRAVGHDIAGADRDALGAQLVAERDEQVDEDGVVDGSGLSHQR